MLISIFLPPFGCIMCEAVFTSFVSYFRLRFVYNTSSVLDKRFSLFLQQQDVSHLEISMKQKLFVR